MAVMAMVVIGDMEVMDMVGTVDTGVMVDTEDMAIMDNKISPIYGSDDNNQVSPPFKISVYKKWMG